MKKHVFVVFTNEVVWDCLAIARMQTFMCGGSYAAVQLLTCGWRTDIDARSSGAAPVHNKPVAGSDLGTYCGIYVVTRVVRDFRPVRATLTAAAPPNLLATMHA